MAVRTVKVDMPAGYFISWFVTTQAANKVTVTLKDESKTYFSASKQSVSIDPPLAAGYGTLQGSNVSLTIDIAQSQQILGTPHSTDILTDDGIVVGKEFTFCIEDAHDKDYNDAAVSIIGWKNKN